MTSPSQILGNDDAGSEIADIDLDRVDDPTVLRAVIANQAVTLSEQAAVIANQAVTLSEQAALIEKLQGELAELKRMLFGKKSERMPPMAREVKKKRKKGAKGKTRAEKEAEAKKRKETADAKKELPTEDVTHELGCEEENCPHCGGARFSDLGVGEVSYEVEYVPPHFKRRRHIRKKKVCHCGRTILTAQGPKRVKEGVQYGPGFHAQVVVAKCADSLPLYRQEKMLRRLGIPITRSTLCEMYHRVAELLAPLAHRLLVLIKESHYVNADETPVPVMEAEKTRRAYIWTFIADKMVAFVFSASRSGKTPVKVLGESQGILQVDGYSGYNPVTTPDTRTRIGCIAHLRRYFFDALKTAPDEAKHVLDTILCLYEVEYEAAEQDILGTDAHLVLRKEKSKPIMQSFKKWIDEQAQADHLPKGPMGKALTYADNNWDAMEVFLTDPKIRLDNNISEGELRIIALMRKNSLFLGHDEAGDNLAILQTLVASCAKNGINPQHYLADVLIRIQDHPASQIDALLPHNWRPPPTPAGPSPSAQPNPQALAP